jgi:phytoene dehydrogenase-like protein
LAANILGAAGKGENSMSEYDGIILGAGHNGLIAQAYLCRAGFKVLALDRLDVAGGGLRSEENPRHPGVLHNTHAFFQRAASDMPWYADLELERHGAAMIQPELNVALILRDGRSLQWWTDFERTHESFAAISAKDARTLRRWYEDFVPILHAVLRPEAAAPPLPPTERQRLLERSRSGRLLLDVSALSPLEFVMREFEHPAVQAGLLFFNGLREVDLRARGFGHHIASLLASPAKAQMSRGGSAAVARALERVVRAHGGEIRLGISLERILVENGRAAGVELAGGEIIRARRFVASSLNPQQTFLELIEPQHLPREWRERAAAFRYNLLAPLFGLHVVLREPPRYRAAEQDARLADAFMVILGLDHVDQFHEIVRHHEAGTFPPMVIWGACPTQFDPTQGSGGKHAAFMWEKLPYRVGGDPANWDRLQHQRGRDMHALWSEYAPNVAPATLDTFTKTPLDNVRVLANMFEGDLLVGAFTNGQVGYNRPFPGAGHYRGHLPGLYLCGSSSHPGGNITGLPGYNAANVILADHGVGSARPPVALEQRIAELV